MIFRRKNFQPWKAESLGRSHHSFWSWGWRWRRFDFLEFRKRTKAWWLGLASAAASGGKKREDGCDECSEDTDHKWIGCEKLEKQWILRVRELRKSLGRSHIRWLAGGRGTGAAGNRKKCGSGSDEGKFHDFDELIWVARWHASHNQTGARLAVPLIPARQKTREP